MESPTPIPDYRHPKSPPVVGALTPEQIVQVQQADRRAKSIKRAARFAASEGTFTMVIAACSLACFMLGWINAFLGILLAIFAFNAIRGAARLRRFDLDALPLLAWNEVFLIAIVTVYSAYSIYTGLASSSGNALTSTIVSPEDIQLLGIDPKIIREFIWGFYLALIVLTALSQGLVGWYYKSRKKHLDTYLAQTPQWIIDFQKAQKSA